VAQPQVDYRFLQKQVEELQKRLRELDARARAVCLEIDKQRVHEIGGLQHQLDELKLEANGLREQLNTASKLLSDRDETARSLQLDLNAARARITQLSLDLAAASSRLVQMAERVKRAESERDAANRGAGRAYVIGGFLFIAGVSHSVWWPYVANVIDWFR
jgi:chromosome segregation ATPase